MSDRAEIDQDFDSGAPRRPSPWRWRKAPSAASPQAIGETTQLYFGQAVARSLGYPGIVCAADVFDDISAACKARLGSRTGRRAEFWRGEQGFRYWRLIVAGDRLQCGLRLTDVRDKRSSEGNMGLMIQDLIVTSFVRRHGLHQSPRRHLSRSDRHPRAKFRSRGFVVTRAGLHKPGDTLSIRRGPITTTQLVMYAGASGDFNRIHYDHPFAVEKGLGGVIAHGMLTMAFAASCAVEAFGPAGRISNIEARFTAPVRVGDVVAVTVVVERRRVRWSDRGSAHRGGRWPGCASRCGRGSCRWRKQLLKCRSGVMDAVPLADTGAAFDPRTLRNAFGCFPRV